MVERERRWRGGQIVIEVRCGGDLYLFVIVCAYKWVFVCDDNNRMPNIMGRQNVDVDHPSCTHIPSNCLRTVRLNAI